MYSVMDPLGDRCPNGWPEHVRNPDTRYPDQLPPHTMSAHKLPSQTLLKLQSLKCSECSYITAYPNALQVHRLKAHAKGEKPDKPYKCGVCSYQTSFRSNLQKHQRVHTGEKPYVCACCCMRFSFRSNHKRHEQRCLAVRGLTPFQNPQCGLSSSRYTSQPSYSLPSANTTSAGLSKPETCGMDTKQGGFSLAMNHFELPHDENQRAMMDFYYKAFHDPTTMVVAPAGLSLPHLTANPMAGYPLEESEFKVKIKQEPADRVPPSLENATRGTLDSTDTKGRTSCPRKQSHPRKTQSDWVHSITASIQEDIKPNLAELDQEAAMDCRMERASRHCDRGNIDSSQEDLKRSSRIRIFSGSTRTGQRSRSRSPRNHCIRKIKKENRASSPVSLNDVQRDRSPVRRTGCSTSTSATPSSVADTETNCSLPFTLDAVLGDLSLGNLIDMLVQNGRIYRCHHCKILFEEYATYILHMGCHGSTNPFSCHFCGLGFHEKFGFLTHFMKCVGK